MESHILVEEDSESMKYKTFVCHTDLHVPYISVISKCASEEICNFDKIWIFWEASDIKVRPT